MTLEYQRKCRRKIVSKKRTFRFFKNASEKRTSRFFRSKSFKNPIFEADNLFKIEIMLFCILLRSRRNNCKALSYYVVLICFFRRPPVRSRKKKASQGDRLDIPVGQEAAGMARWLRSWLRWARRLVANCSPITYFQDEIQIIFNRN